MVEFIRMRQLMVENVLLPNRINQNRLMHAFQEVPREIFVSKSYIGLSYAGMNLPLNEDRYILKPLTLGRILQALNLAISAKVLIVGAGLGYSAAITSYCCSSVYALESDPKLYQMMVKNLEAIESYNVHCFNRPLVEGVPERAPYDIVFIEGGVETNMTFLKSQVKESGQLVFLYPHPNEKDYDVKFLTKADAQNFCEQTFLKCEGYMLKEFIHVNTAYSL